MATSAVEQSISCILNPNQLVACEQTVHVLKHRAYSNPAEVRFCGATALCVTLLIQV